mgnify:CR=1 FL=1
MGSTASQPIRLSHRWQEPSSIAQKRMATPRLKARMFSRQLEEDSCGIKSSKKNTRCSCYKSSTLSPRKVPAAASRCFLAHSLLQRRRARQSGSKYCSNRLNLTCYYLDNLSRDLIREFKCSNKDPLLPLCQPALKIVLDNLKSAALRAIAR